MSYTIDGTDYISDTVGGDVAPGVKIYHGATGTGTMTSAESPLPVTGSFVKAEDAQHTSGDVGIPALGVRQDTATSLAGTQGDYTMPIFDSSGRLYVRADYVAAADNTTDSISAALDTSYIMDDHTRIAPKFTSGTISAGIGTIVGGVASKKIRILHLNVSVSGTAGTFNILNGTTSILGARTGISGLEQYGGPWGLMETGTNTALVGSTSAGVLGYNITYAEV